MSDVSQYPVTFGYGDTSPPYGTPSMPFHRGEDRACPSGTPVIVNGVQIGLSGSTGWSTGPHLHIGRFAGGSTNPNGGGFSFGDAVVTQVKEDNINGKYVRVQADGASWVYLHLSEQTCSVGQHLTAPAPQQQPPFTLTDITPKQITINRPTNRWNMGYQDLQQMKDNPVEALHQGAGPFTVTIHCKQRDTGYEYYLQDRFNLGGFNIYDCSDYIAPVSTEPVVEPEKPKQWPTPPATASDTTPYTVVKLIDGYETSNKAANRIQPAKAPVGAGYYTVFNKRYADSDPSRLVAINVTQKLGQPGYWINPEDNVPDVIPEPTPPPEPAKPVISDWPSGGPRDALPVPAPEPLPEHPVNIVVRPNWRSSYTTFKDVDGYDEERLYVAEKDFAMVDQESTNRTAPVKKNDHIWLAGTFIGPDDKLYGMPSASRKDKLGNARYWYYGCPLARDHVRTEQEVYNTTTTRKEREVIKIIQDVRVLNNKERNRQHAMRVADLLTITPKEIETFVGRAIDFFSGNTKRKTVTINKKEDK